MARRRCAWLALLLLLPAPGQALDAPQEPVAPDVVEEAAPPSAGLFAAFDPPLSPLGAPWAIELHRRGGGRTDPSDAAVEANATEIGILELRELDVGDYLLIASDADGGRWAEEELSLSSGENVVQIQIPVIEVVGSIHHDREPVVGRLQFGPGPTSERRVVVDTDEEGDFVAFLPEEGLWEVDLEWPAEDQTVALEPVEVRTPRHSRRARADLELPFTRIEGTVIDQNQIPVASALVRLVSTSPGRKTRVSEKRSAEDGSFRFLGMAAGLVALQATAAEGESEWTHLTLIEGFTPAKLPLVLRQRKPLRIHVVSEGGPVAGALALVLPARSGPAVGGYPEMLEGVTDRDGVIETALPAETEEVSLVVMAAGYALSIASQPVQGEAITIALGVSGGTLKLPQPHPRASLTHGDAEIPVALLRRWVALQGDDAATLHALVARNVEPGDYAYCLPLSVVLETEEVETPSMKVCFSGVLEPSDALVLTMPAGE